MLGVPASICHLFGDLLQLLSGRAIVFSFQITDTWRDVYSRCHLRQVLPGNLVAPGCAQLPCPGHCPSQLTPEHGSSQCFTAAELIRGRLRQPLGTGPEKRQVSAIARIFQSSWDSSTKIFSTGFSGALWHFPWGFQDRLKL